MEYSEKSIHISPGGLKFYQISDYLSKAKQQVDSTHESVISELQLNAFLPLGSHFGPNHLFPPKAKITCTESTQLIHFHE